jgi:hypothetical protein
LGGELWRGHPKIKKEFKYY